MTTHDYTRPGDDSRLFLPLVSAVLQHMAALIQTVQNRRQVAKLLEWDSRMLRDIGVTQGDVRSAMASPLGEDPSYRLGAMARERRHAFHAAARERLEREGGSRG
jgi:uncharacterized protein YjiS (DUF1127 family)